MSITFKIRVWDLPTRVFHWALLIFFLGLLTTAQIGGTAMTWHFRFGYAVLTLLLFRLIWGVVGGHWSRFSSFVFTPTSILLYLKGQGRAEHTIGHNPLGAASVFAMLGFLLLQVASGLISDDEIATMGPLAQFVSSALSSRATFYHAEIGKLVLISLAVIHVGTILFYLVKRRTNLVRPMLDGDKEVPIATRSSRDDASSRALAGTVLLVCAALVAGMLELAG